MIDATTAGPVAPARMQSEAAIAEIRRITGLTWGQIACVLDVTPRTLHLWASGGAMLRRNEERVHRLLGVLRRVDCGASDVNRRNLTRPLADGSLPVDLLRAGDFDRILAEIGRGQTESSARPGALSTEAKGGRRPPPPEELVDALQERVHREGGRHPRAKSKRLRRGRPDAEGHR